MRGKRLLATRPEGVPKWLAPFDAGYRSQDTSSSAVTDDHTHSLPVRTIKYNGSALTLVGPSEHAVQQPTENITARERVNPDIVPAQSPAFQLDGSRSSETHRIHSDQPDTISYRPDLRILDGLQAILPAERTRSLPSQCDLGSFQSEHSQAGRDPDSNYAAYTKIQPNHGAPYGDEFPKQQGVQIIALRSKSSPLTQGPSCSSTSSQKKRGASSSPSRPQVNGSTGVSKKYVQHVPVSASSLARRKQDVRTASGLRSVPLVSKPGHHRSQSACVTVTTNPYTTQKVSPTRSFAPNLEKLNARRRDTGKYVALSHSWQPQHFGPGPPLPTGPQPHWNPDVRAPAYANVSPNLTEAYGYGLAKQQGILPVNQPRYDMVLQPKSSPLTQEQLGAEVKGIYAGLVMVEAKCIHMDNARAADPHAEVSKEDWQTLIALHRTLLYEHHDFLMATQHPSASSALRGLASKYCMPARMWKHGIHSFLEVLRHRRPQSQEYMLTFIYLAYQMMCLLYDTIPSYLDTWIECLGDLARYRMAIEEDKETHAVWCAVAARWYQQAADRHPQVGRLYHHLGILERPSLRKFYFYSRSLTSVVPFLNAAESLGTLCVPILQDDTAIRCGNHSAEAMTICFHARVFTAQAKDSTISLKQIEQDGIEAHKLIKDQPSAKIASYGVALAVTNIAAIFQYGLQENVFRAMYSEVIAREAHNNRPSTQDPDTVSDVAKVINATGAQSTSSPLEAVLSFWSTCFNSLVDIDPEIDQATLRDLMQYVHVNLVWISSLINLRDRLRDQAHINRINGLFSRLDWTKLATFLNAISPIDPITQRVEVHAMQNIFLMPDRPSERKPLVEDYMLRGIVWAEHYPSPELFYGMEDDDGSRTIDTPARLHLRAERVLWLACLIAQVAKKSGLQYDRSTQQFAARVLSPKLNTPVEPKAQEASIDDTASLNERITKHILRTDDNSSMTSKSMDVLQMLASSTDEEYEIVPSESDVRSMRSANYSRTLTPSIESVEPSTSIWASMSCANSFCESVSTTM